MARIREEWDRMIELFAEVALPNDTTAEPYILRTYPLDYSNQEILSSVPYFSYPCAMRCDVITHFSFVLTNINSKWTFGYCRHTPKSDTCLVLLSDLPWHSTFYRILDHCAELLTRQSSIPLEHFLEALYTSDLPQPGLQLSITYTLEDIKLREFSVACPDHQKLPCIPDDRNLTEYFNAVNPTNMIAIFASMLNERRIVITSNRLNRLSACVQAANALIYPMHWQHIFIPLLPSHLLDYLSAPMPFLIGVPEVTLSKISRNELGDIVQLNADTNQFSTPFDDVSTLPSDVVHNLRKALRQSSTDLGDGLCRAFMRALVSLIGGYHDALRVVPGENIAFDRDAFVSSVRGTSRQLFLERILQLQIFQQFIDARLEYLNRGERIVDEFELELKDTNPNSRFRDQYREWTATMRKEGGAFLRSVNPKVKSAISRSAKAVRNFRSRITPPNPNNYGGVHSRPTSAPTSPKLPPKIKKSISGTAISQTSRTVTYVRTPQASNSTAPSNIQQQSSSTTTTPVNNRLIVNITNTSNISKITKAPPRKQTNNKNSNRISSNTLTVNNNGDGGGGGHVAPAASSESSDIDENEFSYMPRVDMNITAELEDIFRNKVDTNTVNTATPSGSINHQFNNNHRNLSRLTAAATTTPSHSNNSQAFDNDFAPPIPPPRSDRINNSLRFAQSMLSNSNTNHVQNNNNNHNKSTPNKLPPVTPSTTTAGKCLIEFDSPPKEHNSPAHNNQQKNSSALGALVFDPLFENNFSNGVNGGGGGLSNNHTPSKLTNNMPTVVSPSPMFQQQQQQQQPFVSFGNFETNNNNSLMNGGKNLYYPQLNNNSTNQQFQSSSNNAINNYDYNAKLVEQLYRNNSNNLNNGINGNGIGNNYNNPHHHQSMQLQSPQLGIPTVVNDSTNKPYTTARMVSHFELLSTTNPKRQPIVSPSSLTTMANGGGSATLANVNNTGNNPFQTRWQAFD